MIDILVFSLVTICLLLTTFNYLFKRPNYNKLKNQTVLITGASSGLGKALAFKFYQKKCKVILCARNIEALREIQNKINAQEDKVEVYKLDVTDLKNIEDVVQEIHSTNQQIDILVNNAGISHRGDIMTSQIDVFRKVMDVNFFGQVAMTKAVLPNMIKMGHGLIVGIGSVQAKIAIPFRAPYTSSKHASQAFYDSLRPEVFKHGVDVLTINPGYIQTNISQNALTGDGSTYGKMDPNTSNGMSVDVAADKVIEAICFNQKDVLIAPFHHKLAVLIRVLCPSLFFWIMRKRTNKSSG